MKKLFLCFIVYLLMGTTCYAIPEYDYSTTEVSLSYGFLPYSDFRETPNDKLLKNIFTDCVETDVTTTGSINFTFNYRFTQTLGIGFDFSYAGEKSQWIEKNMKVGDKNIFYLSFMPRMKFNWVHNKFFVLYSSAAIGAMWKRTKGQKFYHRGEVENIGDFFEVVGTNIKNEAMFSFQISPFGMEIGNHIGGFIEAGFGQMGVVQAGLRFRW